jgi:geranylgeranyl reductase
MVDREVFDPWLRERAAAAGAVVRSGQFTGLERTEDGRVLVRYRPVAGAEPDAMCTVRARAVVGADGTNSRVARAAGLDGERIPYVFAYHEVIASPHGGANTTYDSTRCDVIYRGETSPDFYAWIFPHGQTLSVGTGSARKGFDLRTAVAAVRDTNGLAGQTTLRREGAPLPLRPRRRWDDRRNVVLAGDAAGVVAPASGEGIYYAMLGGQLAAEAVDTFLATGDQRDLATARRRFMRQHGIVFRVLGLMQSVWYGSDRRRERFVSICRDVDVQRLTFESYMRKRLVFARPFAHVRIFFKDVAHLLGLARI